MLVSTVSTVYTVYTVSTVYTVYTLYAVNTSKSSASSGRFSSIFVFWCTVRCSLQQSWDAPDDLMHTQGRTGRWEMTRAQCKPNTQEVSMEQPGHRTTTAWFKNLHLHTNTQILNTECIQRILKYTLMEDLGVKHRNMQHNILHRA